MSQSTPADVQSTAHWAGPFPGFNAYNECDHTFVRCESCGIEVVPSRKEHASHRAGCPHGDA